MLSAFLATLCFLPGGNVSAFYSENFGKLNLVGDSQANEILVTSYETDYVWVLPLGTTTINGRQGWQYFYLERGDASGDVFVSLGAGDDLLEFERQMPRGLIVDMGSGIDVARGVDLLLEALRISGSETVEISQSYVRRTLITDGNVVHLRDFRIGIDLAIECGSGNDEVWLDDIKRLNLLTLTTVRTGDGDDSVRFTGPLTGPWGWLGPMLFDGGKGLDVYEGWRGIRGLQLTEFEQFGPSPRLARR
jgi:hypothetical protein